MRGENSTHISPDLTTQEIISEAWDHDAGNMLKIAAYNYCTNALWVCKVLTKYSIIICSYVAKAYCASTS